MHAKEKEPATDGIRLVIKKSERTLEIYSADRCIRSIKVSLGADPFGDKERRRRQTPKGAFTYLQKILKAGTSFRSASAIQMQKMRNEVWLTG